MLRYSFFFVVKACVADVLLWMETRALPSDLDSEQQKHLTAPSLSSSLGTREMFRNNVKKLKPYVLIDVGEFIHVM